jgi:hypothetical protein
VDTSPLYKPHTRALSVLFGDIEQHALGRGPTFVGTAGSVIERSNASGFRFFAHQYYDGAGKKRERYLAGPVGESAAENAAAAVRARISDVKGIVPTLRLLGREGFSLVDAKTYGTVASLANLGLFAAGGMLVGSHAYGVLLNRLGVRAAPYSTEDIDLARGKALAVDRLDRGFLEILRESGVDFVEVPQLDPKRAPTSFKERGRSRFRVDLLAPSRNETFPVVPVPELGAHAMGLPYLDYLLADSQMSVLLAREGCCAVRVPVPERFAVHKLIVSRVRAGRTSKSDKDTSQAIVVLAALAVLSPGAIEDAVARIPKRSKKHWRRALDSVKTRLEYRAPRAWEELNRAPP